MANKILRGLTSFALWGIICVLAGCSSINLAGYDQRAYENATSLKPETLALVVKSGIENSYSTHEEKVDSLFVKLESAYEYANGVDNNNEAAANWRDLISDILKNWQDIWKQEQQLSSVAADEIGSQISSAFDTIICLEANKRQLTQCSDIGQ